MSEILTDSKLKHCLLEARNINVSYMQRTEAAQAAYTSHEQLRAENERLRERLVAQDKVIEAAIERLTVILADEDYENIENFTDESLYCEEPLTWVYKHLLATIGKGTSTTSVTMEPDA